MDRSKMLIQQLALAASRGEDNSVLLALVEEIRNELSRPVQAAPVGESISVMMPDGFQPRAATAPGMASATAAAPRTVLSVPRPPAVVVVEEEPEPAVPVADLQPQDQEGQEPVQAAVTETSEAAPETAMAPFLADAWPAEAPSPWMPQVTLEPPLAEDSMPQEPVVLEASHPSLFTPESPAAEPLTLELPLTPEMIAEATALEMEAARPAASLPVETAPEPQPLPEAAPQDLNGKMAQRNKMLNEIFARPEPDLAAVLATPRIADLRKAISINEKYQFINTLFRGDEDMFERSIKTLNNFQVMQEANYWMQRELLIKLGWNDEDELVQRFFELVSRRFS